VTDLRGEHERGQHDRNGAAQAGPAEQQPLGRGELVERGRQPHGRRPDQHGEQRREPQTGKGDLRQVAGKHQQAEDHEHRDLGEERQPLVEGDELAAVPGRGAADGETDQVDGEEAAAADHVGDAE
jgi:hypothetical protein